MNTTTRVGFDGRAAALLGGTVLAALALSRVPLLHVPFEWFETYFHEMSHGIVAVATGGTIERLELNLDGSGTLWHSGSHFPALVSFAGYAGAFWFGAVLYLAASASAPQSAGKWGLGLAGCVALSTVLWVRDLHSLVVAAVLVAAFLGLWRLGGNRLTQWLLQFTGVYVVTSAFSSPLWLLWGGARHSDAAALRKATGLPELVWIVAWLVFGAAVVRWAVRSATRGRSAAAVVSST